MSRTLCVVDLPGQVFDTPRPVIKSLAARRFAGISLLEWVVRRATEIQRIKDVVVLLSTAQASVRSLVPADVAVHVSSQPDALSRLAEACQASNVDAVVRVCVDTPFIDPVLVDQLISTANASHSDYATYCSGDGRSAMQSRLGLVAEWCKKAVVMQAHRQAQADVRNCPTQFIWSHPELFQLKFIPVPSQLDRDDLRLAIDNEEDWEHAHEIFEALGPEDLDWQRIAVLLAEQPAMRRRMALSNQRQHD